MTYNQNLIYLSDVTFENSWSVALNMIFIISIIFSISVIIIKNPISSILCLIALFFSVACYLSILGMTFIGLSYLLVYVGAISILFLFILMLINIRVSELTVNTTNSIPLVLIVSIFFFLIISQVLPGDLMYTIAYTYKNVTPLINYFTEYTDNSITNNDIYYTSSNNWDANLAETAHISTIGNIMYSTYFIWLILTSVILLLAMVGCIVITIKG